MQETPRHRRRRSTTPSLVGEDGPRIAATGLLLIGLVIGLTVGLVYAWLIDPVVYVDAIPARLGEDYKAEYIFLVSQSYAADGDWERAQRRLQALDDADLPGRVDALLESYLLQQKPPDVIRNLAELAQQLGAEGTAVSLFAPTPLSGAPTPTPIFTATPAALPTDTPSPTATPTNTPPPTPTPFPTAQPSPTAQPDYRLLNQERLCDRDEDVLRIEVITYDALLNELPGIEVLVTWQGGEDTFFTGFKPAFGPGYGDFTMQPDVSYSVQLLDGSPEVSGLRIEPCESGQVGGWRLSFQNLRLALTPTATPER
ncbi:MAG: hypothetical protein KC443_00910 [Anaerolineales bacterium]|nr:hypothetical protein [Anaerolineales bacterium]